jgi:GTP-binding protein
MKIKSAEFVIGAASLAQIPVDDLPQIAFAGRSNVGKSSLQNALVQRKKLIRTSSTPGKTREINFYKVNEAFYFADLPGFGYAKFSKSLRAKISKLITKYLEESPNITGIVYLIDMKTQGTAIDTEILDRFRELQLPTLVVCTKMDKLNQKDRKKTLVKIQEKFNLEELPLMVSSQKKQGLTEVWQALFEAITIDT